VGLPSADELERFAALAEQLNLPIDPQRLESIRAMAALRETERAGRAQVLETARRLKRESDGLAAHNEMLAHALGACPHCWGNLDDCEACAGEGVPGTYPPDKAAFDHYVMPAVRQFMTGRLAAAPEFGRARRTPPASPPAAASASPSAFAASPIRAFNQENDDD
jgi:hypothetical protein